MPLPDSDALRSDDRVSRRRWMAALAVGSIAGCGRTVDSKGKIGQLDSTWGQLGISGERMHKPRAMAIDSQDRLYVVDFTARILVYDADGGFLRSWQTPQSENGRPTGLTYDRAAEELLVADTHYYRILAYSSEGELREQRTVGGVNGRAAGQFGFVTDAVRDSAGCLYVSEYGDNDRVQKFSPAGEFLLQWGSHGTRELQFKRPQNLAVDKQDRIWVCDACNHRIKVFNAEGELLFAWGSEGSGAGQMYYPYDLVIDDSGDLFVAEYGNHRIQKFTESGESLGWWGSQGSSPGELWSPWALVRDSRGRLHVLDTLNHRVQRILV